VARALVVATAGAGGDLPPLMALAGALRDRGHDVSLVGDASVDRMARKLGLPGRALPPEVDLGPRLVAAIREAMEAADGDLAVAGPIVQERMAVWASEAAALVAEAIGELRPDVVLTSLFGVEVLATAAPPRPWAVVNSTFYIGPNPPRPLEDDLGPRALPLLARYATLLDAAGLVLHATDRVFDLGFDELPPRHRYVGPLGIWEPPSHPPAYLAEPGDPWVLVTISSQLQDDVPLAQAALGSLADSPVRVLLTIGKDHDPAEIVATGNARVKRTVSHAAVLEHGRLLVSHAGHGSVMKALWFGRPMVLVPWGRDQPGVAARAHALGVAEVVPREEAEAGALAAAVSRALADEGMAEAARGHRDRLRATDPPGEAAALVETLL
jgi:UDP:flavonoid glycosyltransferase YjiC (YdhE family)